MSAECAQESSMFRADPAGHNVEFRIGAGRVCALSQMERYVVRNSHFVMAACPSAIRSDMWNACEAAEPWSHLRTFTKQRTRIEVPQLRRSKLCHSSWGVRLSSHRCRRCLTYQQCWDGLHASHLSKLNTDTFMRVLGMLDISELLTISLVCRPLRFMAAPLVTRLHLRPPEFVPGSGGRGVISAAARQRALAGVLDTFENVQSLLLAPSAGNLPLSEYSDSGAGMTDFELTAVGCKVARMLRGPSSRQFTYKLYNFHFYY
jgi:hypothetical protein